MDSTTLPLRHHQEPLNAPFLNGLFSSPGGRFGPEKKKFSPHPPKFPRSPQTPSQPLGPPPGIFPPLLGFSSKKTRFPLAPAPRTPPSPPRAEKKLKNIRNVHQAVDFQEVKRPLRMKSVKHPIKVGKRPINEGKRPIKAKVLVGVSEVGCLMGSFRAPHPWRKTAPLKRPIKRSMTSSGGECSVKRFGFRPESQSYRPKVEVTGGHLKPVTLKPVIRIFRIFRVRFSCPHFPHFPRFPRFRSAESPQTLVFLGWEGTSAFSAFSLYRA